VQVYRIGGTKATCILTLVLHKCELSALSSDRFILGNQASVSRYHNRLIRWVDPRASLETVTGKIFLLLPGIEPWSSNP